MKCKDDLKFVTTRYGYLYRPQLQLHHHYQGQWKSLKCGCAVHRVNPNPFRQDKVFSKGRSPKKGVQL